MGVRFACHACGKRLNIKTELAGRRGICPSCSVRFRIPMHDTETSTPVHSSAARDSSGGHDPVEDRDDSESSDAVFTAGEDERGQRTKLAAPEAPSAAPLAAVSPQPRAATSTSGLATEPAETPAAATTAAAAKPTLEEVLGGKTATWYVRPPGGGQYGPADGPTLGEWIHEGRVSETAMLWRDGWPDWRSAQQVLPFSMTATAPVLKPQTAVPQPAPPSEPEAALRTGGKVLPTNKNKVSQKRIAISVMLACILLVLAVALVLVLKQSA